MKKKLVLFDFDGTLTTEDTMFSFISFCRGKGHLIWSLFLLSPWLVGLKLGAVSRERAKEKLLTFHFKGWTRTQLREKAELFAQQILPALMRPKGLVQLEAFLAEGAEVWIVSASLDIWLKPFLNGKGWKFLSTKGQFIQDRFTGKIEGPNLHGPAKVSALRSQMDLDSYEPIIAFGDSSGDAQMLGIAHEAHFKPFRNLSQEPSGHK